MYKRLYDCVVSGERHPPPPSLFRKEKPSVACRSECMEQLLWASSGHLYERWASYTQINIQRQLWVAQWGHAIKASVPVFLTTLPSQKNLWHQYQCFDSGSTPESCWLEDTRPTTTKSGPLNHCIVELVRYHHNSDIGLYIKYNYEAPTVFRKSSSLLSFVWDWSSLTSRGESRNFLLHRYLKLISVSAELVK